VIGPPCPPCDGLLTKQARPAFCSWSQSYAPARTFLVYIGRGQSKDSSGPGPLHATAASGGQGKGSTFTVTLPAMGSQRSP